MGFESVKKVSAAQHRLHLTASGVIRGGQLVEKVILRSLVFFKSAAAYRRSFYSKML